MRQSIDFKDYYYKYKALKYYLKNIKIKGGTNNRDTNNRNTNNRDRDRDRDNR
jgi:hypothetical protein